MTIEDTLRHELRDVTAKPSLGPDLQTTLASGRSRRRRRTAGRVAGAGLLAGAVAVAAVALLPWGDTSTSSDGDQQWALAVPPEDINPRILDLLRAALPSGTELTDVQMKAWPADDDGNTSEAVGPGSDDGSLPPERWDEAVEWSVSADVGDGHELSVSIMHAESETEGDSAQACRSDLRAELYLVCDVGTDSDTGVETTYRLASERWGSGAWYVAPPSDIDPDQQWFSHEVEAQPGGDFLLRVVERVKTPTRAGAEAQQLLDRETMTGLVLDPDLLAAG